MISRACPERLSTTTRALNRFIQPLTPIRCDKPAWTWDGRFLRMAVSDGSRTPGGVRYNRLVRLKRRIGGTIPDRW